MPFITTTGTVDTMRGGLGEKEEDSKKKEAGTKDFFSKWIPTCLKSRGG